jgi:hypothetical protein
MLLFDRLDPNPILDQMMEDLAVETRLRKYLDD